VGAYEITGFIAAGGMGDVYRARHTVLDREVAVKSVRAESGDDAARRRLIREARHASVLKHPGICTIHEVVATDDGPFIVMKFVDGRSLRELLQERPLSVEEALANGIQVAAALEHAHAHGIVHRDLKSSNVVVEAAGRAVVLDFGLARRLPCGDADAAHSTLTRHGALAGTLSHIAPEVLLGRDADERSDVWGAGHPAVRTAPASYRSAGRRRTKRRP
jgi:serine/threonine protein kinase